MIDPNHNILFPEQYCYWVYFEKNMLSIYIFIIYIIILKTVLNIIGVYVVMELVPAYPSMNLLGDIIQVLFALIT